MVQTKTYIFTYFYFTIFGPSYYGPPSNYICFTSFVNFSLLYRMCMSGLSYVCVFSREPYFLLVNIQHFTPREVSGKSYVVT